MVLLIEIEIVRPVSAICSVRVENSSIVFDVVSEVSESSVSVHKDEFAVPDFVLYELFCLVPTSVSECRYEVVSEECLRVCEVVSVRDR